MFDEYGEYEQAKLAGKMRLVRIAGKLFVIDTRSANAKVQAVKEDTLSAERSELQTARQQAARKLQGIDLLIADALTAPEV